MDQKTMFKSVAATLTLLIMSSQLTYARTITPQHRCQAELRCVIEKSEGILDNLHESEQQLASRNRKLFHALAKQCTSTTQQIQKMLNLLTQEVGLAPHAQGVKQFLLTRLDKDVENKTVYEGSTSLENEDFKTKLYVIDYTSPPAAKDLDVHPTDSRSLTQALEAEWRTVAGKGKVEPWWFRGDKIYYAFSFIGAGTKPPQGLFILDRELDYHTITEECSDSQHTEKDVTKL
jgi:hypothetical protein